MKKKNVLKKAIFAIGIAVILLLVVLIMLKYEVEGEKELPYNLSKILIISTVDGEKVEDAQNLWNINLSQVNDVYVYIEPGGKNENVTIKEVEFSNFQILNKPSIGNCKILRPTGDLENLYAQSHQDYLNDKIVYLGDRIDDLKKLEISNNGGIAGFRIAVNEVGNYISNEDTEVIYDGRLLSKVGVTSEQVKTNLNFDILIKTSDNITYQGTVNISTPAGDISQEGKSNIEITNFDNVVFKRVKN